MINLSKHTHTGSLLCLSMVPTHKIFSLVNTPNPQQQNSSFIYHCVLPVTAPSRTFTLSFLDHIYNEHYNQIKEVFEHMTIYFKLI